MMRPLPPSSSLRPLAAPFPGRRRRRRPPQLPRRLHPVVSLRQVSPWTPRRPETWGRRWWGGRCSTGGPTMAGSAAPGGAPASESLSARRLLACCGLHPADVGAARHGGHAARRRLLVRHPLGAGSSGAGHGLPSNRCPVPSSRMHAQYRQPFCWQCRPGARASVTAGDHRGHPIGQARLCVIRKVSESRKHLMRKDDPGTGAVMSYVTKVSFF